MVVVLTGCASAVEHAFNNLLGAWVTVTVMPQDYTLPQITWGTTAGGGLGILILLGRHCETHTLTGTQFVPEYNTLTGTKTRKRMPSVAQPYRVRKLCQI